jgi:CHAT domain-containing protein
MIQALMEADLIHFQGHARYDAADALRSRLLLAKGEVLDAGELLGLRIHPRTIVLGACESAAQHPDPGDEILGLIPAFLLAGATRVVAAQWRVHERAAAAFMEEFYTHARNAPLIDAVRKSALAVRAQPEFASPLFWAPFMLYGSGWEAL